MKKAIFLIITISLFVNATDAQWYERKCGVIDLNNCTAEEYECLESHIRSTITEGGVAIALGTPFIIYSIIMDANAKSTGDLMDAMFIRGIGGLFYDVGIPILIVGKVRKSKLNKIPNYKNFKEGSLGLSPTIGFNQFNNTYNYGVTLSFNF